MVGRYISCHVGDISLFPLSACTGYHESQTLTGKNTCAHVCQKCIASSCYVMKLRVCVCWLSERKELM